MKKKVLAILLLTGFTATLTAACANSERETVSEASPEDIKKGGFTVAASCHDPQVIAGEDGSYYMFGSHMVAAKSDNLKDWNYFATKVDASNKLFDNLFTGNFEAFSFVGKNAEDGYSVWAPDVIYNKTMKKYVMYFCTTSSFMKSSLCFATADKLEGPYTYQDTFLHSGFGESDAGLTNLYEILGTDADISRYLEYGGYNNKKWPNCIDPSTFYDEKGVMWMVYGSWSGGIFLLQLDPATGYPVFPQEDKENEIDAYYGKQLVGGGHHSVEGPYIQYNEENGYYYLFVSFGELKREGGYQIRQFRSKQVDGPYEDTAGNTLKDQEDHFNYGLKMMGNYTFPSLSYTYMAPGGQSAFQDSDGRYFISYHQRFDDGTEYFEPRVHQMFTNKEGWFVAAPFAYNGETLSEQGYRTKDIQGTFYITNHGTDINALVNEGKSYQLQKKGVITEGGQTGKSPSKAGGGQTGKSPSKAGGGQTGKSPSKAGGGQTGTFEVEEGTNYITLTLDNEMYQGVIVEMEDEAGNKTLCFTACSSKNETIWGVQYLKGNK